MDLLMVVVVKEVEVELLLLEMEVEEVELLLLVELEVEEVEALLLLIIIMVMMEVEEEEVELLLLVLAATHLWKKIRSLSSFHTLQPSFAPIRIVQAGKSIIGKFNSHLYVQCAEFCFLYMLYFTVKR